VRELKVAMKISTVRLIAVISTIAIALNSSANAATFDSVSHIHHIKLMGNKVLVLTHEGLYELISEKNMKLIGEEKIDVMGLASLGKVLVASGHPAVGSKMPDPIGLIKSTDGGLKWESVSLLGKVDFHFLEGAGTDLYGADSQSGNLLYSANSGRSWRSLGVNTYTDIAISPTKSGTAVAIKDSKLLITDNAFKSSVVIKSNLNFDQIEWRKSGLYALSGSSIYKSINSGESWKKLNEFKTQPGILSSSEQLLLVTVGSAINISKDSGRKFTKIS
jgi:hypothetical protein